MVDAAPYLPGPPWSILIFYLDSLFLVWHVRVELNVDVVSHRLVVVVPRREPFFLTHFLGALPDRNAIFRVKNNMELLFSLFSLRCIEFCA